MIQEIFLHSIHYVIMNIILIFTDTLNLLPLNFLLPGDTLTYTQTHAQINPQIHTQMLTQTHPYTANDTINLLPFTYYHYPMISHLHLKFLLNSSDIKLTHSNPP